MSKEKIKVALLSFHNAYNYGAAMQAYGLQEALLSMGFEAEYIDYVNEHRKYVYDTPYQVKSAIKNGNAIRAARLAAGAGFISARGKKFKAFYDKYLHKTKVRYKNSEEAASLNDSYDKFIVGSDQVWNCKNNGGDTAYILDFVTESEKKFSYASSFGMDDIPSEYFEGYTDSLSKLGRIAVREVAGAELVKKYTGRTPRVVLDPVFLAGLDTWENLKKDGSAKKEAYIFFYTNRDSQIRDFWNTGYPRGNLKSHILSSFVGFKDFADRNVSVRVAMAPTDFLNEISSAKLVVTASFHCVAFSILFHKKFVVFLTGNRGKDERILTLLRICGLESRILNANTTIDEINSDIDYIEVDKRLEPYLDYSRAYLKNAVLSMPDVDDLEFPNGISYYFCNDERCSGCMACVNACPVKAITAVKNNEGFFVPVRNSEQCINCNKCHSVCQVYSPVKRNIEEQKYYAVKNDDKERRKSSSGGAFAALSDIILRRNGIICAATMDDTYTVKHVFAFDQVQRDKMRGTFYVQSDVSSVYTEIKNYLKQGKTVLFVGTPCQVAGLYKVLENVNTECLHTCDIVCHGTPSPGVFQEFIQYLKEKNNTLSAFHFRDKKLGWKHGYTVSACYGNKKVFNTLELQSFSKLFSHNIINRTSCANCAYTNYKRVGDITIGDFWGIEKSHNDFKDDLGVSLLIVNDDKGRKLLECCKELKLLPVTKEQTRQNSLTKVAEPSSNRMDAFRILNRSGYVVLARKYGECNSKGKAKNLLRNILNK